MKHLLLVLPLVLLSCKDRDETTDSQEAPKESLKEKASSSKGPTTSPPVSESPDSTVEILPPTSPDAPLAQPSPVPRPKNTTRLPSNEDPKSPTEPEPKPQYQTAQKVPGKPGYVFNPFTNVEVDVRGIPPGELVRDPKDPNHDKKFRTP